MKEVKILNRETSYYFLRVDFMSAYNDYKYHFGVDSNIIESSLARVSILRNMEVESLRTLLKPLIKKLNGQHN